MKGSRANWWVTLIVVGLVMASIGYATGGSASVTIDRGGVHPVKSERNELHVDEPLAFTELEVNVSVGDVRVISGEKFSLDAIYNDGMEPGYSLEGNVLKVYDSGAMESSFQFNVGLIRKTNSVTVVLPADLRLARANVNVDVGDATLESFDVGALEAHASTGKVTLRNLRADELSARSSVGDMIIDNVEVDGQITAKSGTGRVSARNLSCASAEMTSDVGNVELTGIKSAALVVKTGTGDVKASGEMLGETHITAGVGGVDVKLDAPRDQYKVDASTGIGGVRVVPESPNPTDASNLLRLRGGTGSIRVEFLNP